MYKIKARPEDFFVRENITLKLDEKGEFAYFELSKKLLGTEEAVMKICEKCRIPRKLINYSGLKDKHAATVQTISIRRELAPRLLKISNDKMKLKLLGYGRERITLGTHSTNFFRIVIRNIPAPPVVPKVFPNYFGEQRFSKNNAEIGMHIINGNFSDAANLIASSDAPIERKVRSALQENTNDPIRALRQVPKKILTLYIHAYQSFLFNQMLSEYIAKVSSDYFSISGTGGILRFPNDKIPNTEIPLPGFSTEEKLMRGLPVRPRQFVIKQMPELSSEGAMRDALIPIPDIKAGPLEDDELNPGKKKCTVSFTLPKGSYATVVVRALFPPMDSTKV